MSPDSGKTSSENGAPFECPHCDLSFRRREHLNRHLDRHSGVRPHQCSICLKKFPRIDTLKRHVSTHGPAVLADWVQNNPHHRRACQACAKGKQRCDGDGTTACSNCASKGRRCVYRTPMCRSTNESVSVETIGSDLCDIPSDSPNPAQSLVSQPGMQEEIMATRPEDVVGEHLQHTAERFPHSPYPVADESLPSSQFDILPEALMFSSGSSFSMPSMSAPGLDGYIPDFYFGTISSDSSAFLAGIGQPLVDSSNSQDCCMADDEDALIAEYVPHVPEADEVTREYMINMLSAGIPQPESSHTAEAFPSLQYLDTYVQLYFEHFHRRWPVLHVPTFKMSPETWQLVFSVAFIGCQFSEASQKHKHLSLFYQLSPQVLNKAQLENIFDKDPLTYMQSFLLLQHCSLFSGDRRTFIRLQFHRSVLITLCRQLLSQEGTVLRSRKIAEKPSAPWLQWVRAESERRILYFTWMTECLQAALFLIPPLLTIPELQVPLPGPEGHWEAGHQQWQLFSPPQSPTPVCVMLTGIGIHGLVPHSLDSSARLTMLLSSFTQHAAAQDLRRAMMMHTVDPPLMQSALPSVAMTDLPRTALEVLCKCGVSQLLKADEAGFISNDFSVMARVLTILDFTPGRLLYPFARWQSSEHGSSRARKELSRIVSQDMRHARHCMHLAAQLFQYFRMVNTLRHTDTVVLLICTLYIHLCIELVVKPREARDAQVSMPEGGRLIRLDQVSDPVQIEDWLSLKYTYRVHITGIGILEADRSTARLYKESSRIMGRSASKSSFAAALQPVMEMQAAGHVPELQDKG